jgi:hypothetical protein
MAWGEITADVELKNFQQAMRVAPQISARAAALALNTVAERDAMKVLRQGIEQEVNLPDDYVKPRIVVKRKAYAAHLEVVLAARQRPTSLARFAPGQFPGGKGARTRPVTVQVAPGRPQQLKRAFLIRLRAGKALTDENFNVGIAVRLKPGEKIADKRKMVPFGGGLYLLYGPSVDQVMRDVADEKTPVILQAVEDEYLRQFNRLSFGD